MAATVGELHVNLIARTSRFNRGMEQSKRRVSRFGQAAAGVSRQLASFAGALLALVAMRRIVQMFRDTAVEMDRMAKVARKLGIAVDELAALRFAAEKAGIAANTLDMAMQRMTRRAAEAAIGTGEAQAAIKELGLDARELAVGGPYEAMLKIADAALKIEDSGHRLRIFFKLFDSEGAELVNMADQGSEALEKYRDRINELGMATPFAADGIQKMTDSLIEQRLTWKAWKEDIVTGVALWGQRVGAWGGGAKSWHEIAAEQMAAELKERQQRARKAEAQIEMLRIPGRETARKGGQKLLGRMHQDYLLAPLNAWQKRIVLWQKEAHAAGMAASQVELFVRLMGQAGKLTDQYEAHRARISHVKGLIGAQVRGGDGASLQLPGTARPGSQAYYAAVARHGMEATAKKTDEEILKTVREQLVEEKTLNQKIDRLIAQLEFDQVEIR